jgi:hypothetical protein
MIIDHLIDRHTQEYRSIRFFRHDEEFHQPIANVSNRVVEMVKAIWEKNDRAFPVGR